MYPSHTGMAPVHPPVDAGATGNVEIAGTRDGSQVVFSCDGHIRSR